MTTLDPSHIPSYKDTRGGAFVETQPGKGRHQLRIPDLRFEQSYLRSIAPFVHTRDASTSSENSQEKTSRFEGANVEDVDEALYGAPIRIEWKSLLWITARDQILSPFVQGAVWGVAATFIIPWFRGKFAKPPPKPSRQREPSRLTLWLRGLVGGAETNAVLR